MGKHIFYFVVLLMGLYSCSENSVETKYPREQADQEIQIHYKYWFRDGINTFEKTLTKDLVLDGTITIDFWFQPDEQQKIIDTLLAIDFYNLRDTINQNPADSTVIVFEPDPGLKSIRIKFEGIDKTVYWTYVNSYPNEYERLKRLTETIREIVESDAEYQSLPAPREGYL